MSNDYCYHWKDSKGQNFSLYGYKSILFVANRYQGGRALCMLSPLFFLINRKDSQSISWLLCH